MSQHGVLPAPEDVPRSWTSEQIQKWFSDGRGKFDPDDVPPEILDEEWLKWRRASALPMTPLQRLYEEQNARWLAYWAKLPDDFFDNLPIIGGGGDIDILGEDGIWYFGLYQEDLVLNEDGFWLYPGEDLNSSMKPKSVKTEELKGAKRTIIRRSARIAKRNKN
mgnify:CR=1 FL=1